MATASTSLVSTKETTNYARLCCLLVDVGSQALRNTFDRIHPPASLHVVLTRPAVQTTLNSLYKGRRKILNSTQWGQLYPLHSPPTSASFDITLLTVLLRNICGLTPPASGWDGLPAATDTNTEDDIARVKYYRNTLYGHAAKASIDDASFNSYWSEIRAALVRLGGASYGAKIDRLKTDCMDSDCEKDSRLKLLELWKKDDDSMKVKLEDMKDDTYEKLEQMRTEIGSMREKLDAVFRATTEEIKEEGQLQTVDITTNLGQMRSEIESVGEKLDSYFGRATDETKEEEDIREKLAKMRMDMKKLGKTASKDSKVQDDVNVKLEQMRTEMERMREKLDTVFRATTAEIKEEGQLQTVSPSIKDIPHRTKTSTVSTVITNEGGVVNGDGIKLVCPPGAVDSPVYVTITLSDPSNYCGLLVRNDLENDVRCCAPIVILQPSGHVFKIPVEFTTKFEAKDLTRENVVVLHGTETRDGRFVWQDITKNAKICKTQAELNLKLERFSFIWTLYRATAIRVRDIASRLNLLPFHYTISVLFNEKSYPNKLALLFVSREVYHERFFQEHETSAMVRLRGEGFREVQLGSTDGQEEKSIYNHETLNVSLCLDEDYKLTDSRDQHSIVVESHDWWNTGHVIKLSLESTKPVRILCGKIRVTGEYGHSSERYFCELDKRGYVRGLLRIQDAIFNLKPIAQALQMPAEAVDRVIKSHEDDDQQLDVILKHWSQGKDEVESVTTLRKALEGIQQDYRVTQRGQMHVKHLRYFATKIRHLKYEDSEMKKYFSAEVLKLCKTVLRDCCIEMERSLEGVKKAASFANRVSTYLEMCRRMPAANVAKICEQMSSAPVETFLAIVPDLIQITKEMFVHEEVSEPQNGLNGLSDETLQHFVSSVRSAKKDNNVLKLICEVCKILELLCLQNFGKQTTEEIEKWGKSLAILSMLDSLKPFFHDQNFPRDIRLHKRLELFSGHMRDILSNPLDFADEIVVRDFCNLAQSLIHFAKSDPSKLVRFELTVDSTKPPLNFERKNVEYDKHTETFSQVLHIRKEPEDNLQLHAFACVHINGQIDRIGAFQSVIMLSESGVERFEKCTTRCDNVALVKLKGEDSDRVRVVLCSSQREKLSEILRVIGDELNESLVDLEMSQVTHCRLTMRSFQSKEEAIVSLRLKYKWGSEAVDLESKDFVASADSSAKGTRQPEMQIFGLTTPPPQLAEEACTAVFPTSVYGNLALNSIAQLQKGFKIQCEKVEYHFHQTVQQGHVCVTGDNTKLINQTPNQRALPEGPNRSITDEERS